MSAGNLDNRQMLSLLGDPATVDRELTAFARSAKALSSEARRMIEKYPRQWIAIHDGSVQAHASTLRALLEVMDRRGIPRENALVRFVESDIRTLIL